MPPRRRRVYERTPQPRKQERGYEHRQAYRGGIHAVAGRRIGGADLPGPDDRRFIVMERGRRCGDRHVGAGHLRHLGHLPEVIWMAEYVHGRDADRQGEDQQPPGDPAGAAFRSDPPVKHDASVETRGAAVGADPGAASAP